MAASGMQRWVIILSLCNYEFVFHPGVKHGNGVSMSKLPFQNDNLEKGSVLENKVLMIELRNSSVTSNEVAKHYARDPIISKVIEFVKIANL